MSHKETYIQGRAVFACPDFTIRQDQVELEDGRLSRREVICRPDRVLLLPLQGETVLLRQTERPALGGTYLEAPCAPVLPGQSPQTAAQGMNLGKEPRLLGVLRPSPAILQEKVYVFAATIEPMEQPGPDWQAVPLACWQDWAARGQIKDMRLAAALSLLAIQEDWGQEEEP